MCAEERNNIQLIKCRDDREPIRLELQADGKLKLSSEIPCSWGKPGEEIDNEKIRSRIEPWLTALFQSEHLSLLAGSGLSRALDYICGQTTSATMGTTSFSECKTQIEAAANKSALKSGRGGNPNIEDQIRVANELLIGLEYYCDENSTFRGAKKLCKQAKNLRAEITDVMNNFAQSILKGEAAMANSELCPKAFEILVSFLMSFASRTAARDRLHVFTTNYDRYIEAGADLAGLHLLDRFIGGLFPIFRSSRLDVDMHYNPPGIRGEPRYLEGVARFTKLHGSVDWVNIGEAIRRIGLPFGATNIKTYLDAPGLEGVDAMRLMIHPNAAKDRETAAYPYIDLFRDFAAAACRPNHTLVTYGYSFGDEHINRVIEDMLTIPSTHLVIISFNDPMGRILRTYEKISRSSQCTLMVGSQLGNLQTLVDRYLPKPAIDRTTYRMAELLKMRIGTEHQEKKTLQEPDSVQIEGVEA